MKLYTRVGGRDPVVVPTSGRAHIGFTCPSVHTFQKPRLAYVGHDMLKKLIYLILIGISTPNFQPSYLFLWHLRGF